MQKKVYSKIGLDWAEDRAKNRAKTFGANVMSELQIYNKFESNLDSNMVSIVEMASNPGVLVACFQEYQSDFKSHRGFSLCPAQFYMTTDFENKLDHIREAHLPLKFVN